MSLVFIGTPEFAVPSLRVLAGAGHEIAAVVTQPDRPGNRGRVTPPAIKVAALELGLPVVQPRTLRDPDVVAQLRSLGAEAFVLVAYGEILRPKVLEIPPRGVLNVHASLLPRWRGASPIGGAILAGDEVTGVTRGVRRSAMRTQRDHSRNRWRSSERSCSSRRCRAGWLARSSRSRRTARGRR
jgi:methionyl-tRNA formyltransferase